MATDWMWCYENPKEAATEIERLRAALQEIAAFDEDTEESRMARNALSQQLAPEQ